MQARIVTIVNRVFMSEDISVSCRMRSLKLRLLTANISAMLSATVTK